MKSRNHLLRYHARERAFDDAGPEVVTLLILMQLVLEKELRARLAVCR